ncbi:MAG: ABC transporter substrate-binding protein [Actinomycetes bacterium]
MPVIGRHHNRRMLAGAVGVIILALTATACAANTSKTSTSTSASASAPAQVRIAVDNFALGAQMWVAKNQGYFAAENITVVPQTYQTGVAAAQAVIAGQADLAPVLDFAALSVLSNNIRILGAIAAPQPGFHKLAVSASFTGPSDLKGKKIGYVPGTAEAYITTKYVAQNNLQGSVTLVPLPSLFELVGALKTGQIAAAWVWANGVTQVQQDKSLKIAANDSIVPHTDSIFLIAQTTYAEHNAAVITRVLRAFDKASTFINEHTQQAAQIIASSEQGDASTLAAVLPAQGYGLGMTTQQMAALQAIAQFLVKAGKLQLPQSLATYFDLQPMRNAVPSKVTL